MSCADRFRHWARNETPGRESISWASPFFRMHRSADDFRSRPPTPATVLSPHCSLLPGTAGRVAAARRALAGAGRALPARSHRALSRAHRGVLLAERAIVGRLGILEAAVLLGSGLGVAGFLRHLVVGIGLGLVARHLRRIRR